MIRVKVLEDPVIRIDTKAEVTVSDGGYERGYDAGYEKGNNDGYGKGHTDGVEQGYADGRSDGYEEGYEEGKIPVVEKDVNFYNYDGRLLHSYTLEEVQALTELPPAPPMGRDFLVFEEWNWSLEDIKALKLPLSVMATVCPADGSTKAVLEISDARIATVPMYLRQVSGSLSVDWGDGTEPTTFPAATNANRTLEHTYAVAGEYIITISTDGSYMLGHGGTPSSFLFGMNQVLTEGYLGRNANLNNYGFLAYAHLKVVTFAPGVTQIHTGAVWQSNTVESVSLPKTLTKISGNGLGSIGCLKVLSLPASLESISGTATTGSGALTSITIPPKCTETGSRYPSVKRAYLAEGVKAITPQFMYDGIARTIEIPSTVETIGGQAFRGNGDMERIVFKPLVPPTVENVNALEFSSWTIVEVPAESLEAYQNATNYAAIAAQMVGRVF